MSRHRRRNPIAAKTDMVPFWWGFGISAALTGVAIVMVKSNPTSTLNPSEIGLTASEVSG